MPDYNLKINLAKLQNEPFNFVLILGKKGQMLLVSARKLAAKLVMQTKQECDGRVVAKGICVREEGQIVFATRVKPVESWKKTIKEIFRDEKCPTPAVELRQLKESESDEVGGEESEGEETAQAATAQAPSTVPPAPPAPSPDQGKVLIERFAALTRKVAGTAIADAAIKKQLATLFVEGKQLAAGRKFDQLKACLDKIEALANSLAAPTPMVGKVQFEKIHLEWDSGKKAVGARLDTLHKAIVSEFNDPDGNTAAKKLERVLARFNEGLGDSLDGLRNAATPEARKKAAAQSSAIADRYLEYLKNDALVAHLEANPFNIEVQIRQTLSLPLTQLKQQLQQIGL